MPDEVAWTSVSLSDASESHPLTHPEVKTLVGELLAGPMSAKTLTKTELMTIASQLIAAASPVKPSSQAKP